MEKPRESVLPKPVPDRMENLLYSNMWYIFKETELTIRFWVT